MRVTTILIIIVLLAGGYFGAKRMGWIGAGTAAVTDSFTSHFQRGQFRYQDLKYEEAIQELQKALDLDPQHKDAAQCMARMGDCYKDWGKAAKNDEYLKKAIEIYERVATDYPDSKIVGRVKQSADKTRSLGHW